VFADLVPGATGAEVDPSSTLVVVTGFVALVVVVEDHLWRWARQVVTIVHEAGHALVALLTGRRLTGIKLHSDTSGLTISVGRPRGPGMVLTVLAGYLAPSLVGLAGVGLLAADQVRLMLWVGVAVLVGMLVMVRNLYGVLALLVVGGGVVAVTVWADPDVQSAVAYTATWVVLLGAVRPVLELRRQRRRQPGWRSDADILAGITPLPGGLWVAFFALATLAALVGGAYLLLAF
jgi:peptidase M50B-like protein